MQHVFKHSPVAVCQVALLAAGVWAMLSASPGCKEHHRAVCVEIGGPKNGGFPFGLLLNQGEREPSTEYKPTELNHCCQ